MSARTQRDVTRALHLATELRDNPSFRRAGGLEELIELLAHLDARTGRRDPSQRKAAKAKKAARKVRS